MGWSRWVNSQDFEGRVGGGNVVNGYKWKRGGGLQGMLLGKRFNRVILHVDGGGGGGDTVSDEHRWEDGM